MAFAEGVADQIGGLFDVELFHHVGAMPLDGAVADAEKVADLPARLAFGDQLQDLSFAHGERSR